MKILGIAILCLLSACSQREVYESIQTNQRNECDLLSGPQRQECLSRLPPDYQTYEREREALIKGP